MNQHECAQTVLRTLRKSFEAAAICCLPSMGFNVPILKLLPRHHTASIVSLLLDDPDTEHFVQRDFNFSLTADWKKSLSKAGIQESDLEIHDLAHDGMLRMSFVVLLARNAAPSPV